MLEPLKSWYCDVCGEVIETVTEGYVVWDSTKELKNKNIRIIHQRKCDIDSSTSSSALADFVGVEGMVNLTSWLSLGIIKKKLGQGSFIQAEDMDEFVDFFRRVQLPYYEDARRRFSEHEILDWYSDSNEVGVYLPEQLIAMINRPKY